MSTGSEETKRRRARAQWPIRRFLLGAEPPEDVVVTTTPAERMAMAWALSVEAWAVAGKSLPDYERGKAPVHLWRHGERPPDDDQ